MPLISILTAFISISMIYRKRVLKCLIINFTKPSAMLIVISVIIAGKNGFIPCQISFEQYFIMNGNRNIIIVIARDIILFIWFYPPPSISGVNISLSVVLYVFASFMHANIDGSL